MNASVASLHWMSSAATGGRQRLQDVVAATTSLRPRGALAIAVRSELERGATLLSHINSAPRVGRSSSARQQTGARAFGADGETTFVRPLSQTFAHLAEPTRGPERNMLGLDACASKRHPCVRGGLGSR